MKTLKIVFAIVTLCCSINCSTQKKTTASIKDYKLEYVEYDVKDDDLKNLMYTYIDQTNFKKGQIIDESTFRKERARILKLIRKNKNKNYPKENISFVIDTTINKYKYHITAIVK